jgi:hypothetical protein
MRCKSTSVAATRLSGSARAKTTAATAPALVLIFSAETWDVGLHVTTTVSVASSLASILAATLYLVFSRNLFSPTEKSGF